MKKFTKAESKAMGFSNTDGAKLVSSLSVSDKCFRCGAKAGSKKFITPVCIKCAKKYEKTF